MCILQIVSVTYILSEQPRIILKKRQKEKIHNFKARKTKKHIFFDIYLKLI